MSSRIRVGAAEGGVDECAADVGVYLLRRTRRSLSIPSLTRRVLGAARPAEIRSPTHGVFVLCAPELPVAAEDDPERQADAPAERETYS